MGRSAVIARVVPVGALLGILLAGCASARPTVAGSPSSGISRTGPLVLASPADPQGAAGSAPEIFPLRATTYVLDGTLAGLGAQAPVRRMVAHAVGTADVRRWADALGLAGTPTSIPTGYQVAAANGVLTITTLGGTADVSYFLGATAAGGSAGSGVDVPPNAPPTTAPTTSPAPPPTASPAPPPTASPAPPPTPSTLPVPAPADGPNAQAAETIARALLNRVGVLNGQQWATAVSDGGGVAVACAAGVPCPTVPAGVSSRIVTFGLVIDGVSVTGTTWSVTVGSHGRIDAVNGEWDSPALIGTYPLRSTTAVFSDLQHGRAAFVGTQPGAGFAAPDGAVRSGPIAAPTPLPPLKVHITAVTMGIARWEGFDHGGTIVDLVPTYRFRASGPGSGGSGAAGYDIEVLALAPGAVDFTHPTPTAQLPVQTVITPAPAPTTAPHPAPSR